MLVNVSYISVGFGSLLIFVAYMCSDASAELHGADVRYPPVMSNSIYKVFGTALGSSETTSDESFLRKPIKKSGISSSSNAGSSRRYIKFRKTPPTQFVTKRGGFAAFECQASGSPPPQLYWLKNGELQEPIWTEEILTNRVEAPIALSGMTLVKSVMQIVCATPADEAVYTCVAENADGRIATKMSFKVKDGVRRRAMTLDRCLTYRENPTLSSTRIVLWNSVALSEIGTDVSLMCRTAPKFYDSYWLDIHGNVIDENSDPRFQVLKSGDLLISDLKWEDMGTYICAVPDQNAGGENLLNAFVYPVQPPKESVDED